MSNPYITSAQELAAFIRSSDNTLKSRPIWGVSGLSIIKEGARWSFHFKHAGRRYHGTLGTYPQVSLKEAKAVFQRKRFAITDGITPAPRHRPKPRPRTNTQKNVALPTSSRFQDVKVQYFRFRLEQLRIKGNNKLPTKSVARMGRALQSLRQTRHRQSTCCRTRKLSHHQDPCIC